MSIIHYGICNFCDSSCGLEIEHDGENILSIKGDKQNPFSRGHICPKGVAQQDLYNDPDRIRKPLKRTGKEWKEITWEQALDEAGFRIAEIQKKFGNDSVGVYYGNPIGHNYAALLCLLPFLKGFKTRNIFSATSLDSLARMLVSMWVYGSQAVIPVPDIDRTGFLLIIGANPVISHGSIMTAPDTRKRLRDIQKRGGRIVVIDPRRTETADIADAHYFIRPGTDAALLFAIIDVLFKSDLVKPGKVAGMLKGLDTLRSLASHFPPERVAGTVGIPADDISSLARQFAEASSAVCYGRMGVSTQEFGSLATWLVDVLNIITGRLDVTGGYMFSTPAADLVGLAKLMRQPGFFDRWRSRVGDLPEFNNEFPAVAMAEEIETPGKGQIRSFVTMAGNPVLSVPNGKRLERAFAELEFMVSIDYYINETTRHAHILLPSTPSMEEDHYPVLELGMAVRNFAIYAMPLFTKPVGSKHIWEIQQDLIYHLEKNSGLASSATGALKRRFLKVFNPLRQLDLLLRLGPHKLSVEKLKRLPHGLDLGPLESRIEKVVSSRDKLIDLVPEPLQKDVERLKRKLEEYTVLKDGEFLLITRRTMRSINTWMHNSPRLVSGPGRCTIQINSTDADRLGIEEGCEVRIASKVGEIVAPAEVTEKMMPGVVSLPFGWGHDRDGVRLSVAREHSGVSMNDITDESMYDSVCGIAVLDGIAVNISKR